MANIPRPSGSTPPCLPAHAHTRTQHALLQGLTYQSWARQRGCPALVPRHQAHSQLLCVTRRDLAVLRLSTGAGSSPPVQYSSVELQQPPILRSIVPLVWNPSELTAIVIGGER
jgi:hypothetical protein